MPCSEKWFQYALNKGYDEYTACVFSYLMTHRFPKISSESYADEWLYRIKWEKYNYADATTLKVWRNGMQKCVLYKK